MVAVFFAPNVLAIIDPSAKIGENVSIRPYAIIGKNVSIGKDSIIKPHSHIVANTEIGEKNVIGSGAVIGDLAQDLSVNQLNESDNTWLKIGDNNTFNFLIRSSAVVLTKVMVGAIIDFIICCKTRHCHIGHDVVVKNHCLVSHASMIGGHAEIED